LDGTVLFVGAGRHQRRAIRRARELGLRVVAVDRNPEALGLGEADLFEVVDFMDVAAVTEAGRRHSVDGVLTVSADRAVPVVAAPVVAWLNNKDIQRAGEAAVRFYGTIRELPNRRPGNV